VPFTIGKVLKGWGVVRTSPWHFAGLYRTKQEADAKAQEMGAGYVVLFGEQPQAAQLSAAPRPKPQAPEAC
jgi:hypothetical protein